jgi:CBS-domain-containing membrane protein
MKAKDIMTRTVVSIDQDATVLQAARLMLQHHISGLPVVDEQGALVGVLSEGDFLRRSETHTERRRSRWLEFLMGPGRLAGDYVHSHGNRVSEVMSSDLKTVGEDASLEDIVALMEKHRIKRVPVLRAGRLVGIVTRANLMHAMVSLARVASPGAHSDAAIREKLVAEFKKELWAPIANTNVVVHDGVVDLWGMVVDERQRNALKVAAENIPGVTGVKDHLVWIEPTSGIVIEPSELPVQTRRPPVVAAWPRN